MNILNKIFSLFLAATVFSSAAIAIDFIYIEDSLEDTKMVEITPIDLSGKGTIRFEDECDYCPDSLEYNLDTRLTTPFGKDQDIYQLTQWLNHNAMVHYSRTSPEALRITVYSINDIPGGL